jgi:hypothetical protein
MFGIRSARAPIALLLVLPLFLGLAACGGSSSSSSTTTTTTTTTITTSGTPDQRADELLAMMTQAEKLQMVQGGVTTNLTYGYTVPRGAGGWVPENSRLGIPALYFADGSAGASLGTSEPATALPSSIASAASWDVNEAYKYGTVIGAELADYGVNVNLGGNINLTGREPRDGRTFETKGEDPILAGKITAAHINAIQAQHVLGGIKHFAFNDQESGRGTANVLIDERGGRESDLLAFEIGVKDSNVQSVMCSYNLTNGQYDCENSYLLNQVLKGDWSFPGFVMSDWWATHSTAAAAVNGLDQEQPNQQPHSARHVRGGNLRLSVDNSGDSGCRRCRRGAGGRGTGSGSAEERQQPITAQRGQPTVDRYHRLTCGYCSALRWRLGAGATHERQADWSTAVPALLVDCDMGPVVAAERHSGQGAQCKGVIRRRVRRHGSHHASGIIAGGHCVCQPVGQRRHG